MNSLLPQALPAPLLSRSPALAHGPMPMLTLSAVESVTVASDDSALPENLEERIALCVTALVRMMVSQPADVRAESIVEPSCCTLRLTVNPRDLGAVIGRQGRTARSLRILLAAMARDMRTPLVLDLEAKPMET